MPTQSPTIHLLDHCWKQTNRRSWEQLNHVMSAALNLAVQSGMDFNLADFGHIEKNYRPGYWLYIESVYALAIFTENKSAIDSIEKHLERPAIIADEVSARVYQSYAMHGDNLYRNRERLFVGAKFRYGNHMPTVTSFKNGYAVACTYKPSPSSGYSGKINKRFKITRELIIADRKARKPKSRKVK